MGKEKDPELVKQYRAFLKAAERGDAYAQYNLGVCLKNGEGVARDAAQAVVWYRKAAEQGYAYAQFNLGVCLAQEWRGRRAGRRAGGGLVPQSS